VSTGDLSVYAITLSWPASGSLILGAVNPTANLAITMLGYKEPITWSERAEGGITIVMPQLSDAAMPCRWAWTFKLQNVDYL